MPSLSDFLDTLERSKLVDCAKVDAMRAELGERDRNDLAAVIQALVQRRLLTRFQASKILAGKVGPFVLGKYKIMRQLGRGGMSKVYFARHVETRKGFAIKVLPPHLATAERNALARFRREANVGLRLSHPHVAETIEVGEDNGAHFMVMEYIPGQNLFEMVTQGGPLRVWDAARLFAEVATGMEHIHRLGIVHRDIKPSNVMVTPEGTAKLVDMGLASHEDEADQLTRPVTVLGTMDYIAPEQVSGDRRADQRSDIYALGCTLYFALSRHMPFAGGDAMSKIYRHRMEEPEPLEKITKHVPREFAALVRKMMAKDPVDRYQNAGELVHDLTRWMNADLVRGLIGAVAESGQNFLPPPPELDSAELHIQEGISLRSLGNDQPTDAAVPRVVKPAQRPVGDSSPPVPMTRIRLPRRTVERQLSSQGLARVIILLIGLGVLAVILLIVWGPFREKGLESGGRTDPNNQSVSEEHVLPR